MFITGHVSVIVSGASLSAIGGMITRRTSSDTHRDGHRVRRRVPRLWSVEGDRGRLMDSVERFISDRLTASPVTTACLIPPSHRPIVLPSCCHTVPPPHRPTVPPSHRPTVTPTHRPINPQVHRLIVPPFHSPTVPLIVLPFHHSTVPSIYLSTVPPSHR